VPGLHARGHGAIASKAASLGCQLVTVGGVDDHVHVLLSLPATLAVADVVQHLKGYSSRLINATPTHEVPFR